HQRRIKHRGGREQVDLADAAMHLESTNERNDTDLIALDDSLTKLEQLDPPKARVVTLRYFAGLSIEETAAAMDLSPATVKNEWAFARAWLHRELAGADPATDQDPTQR